MYIYVSRTLHIVHKYIVDRTSYKVAASSTMYGVRCTSTLYIVRCTSYKVRCTRYEYKVVLELPSTCTMYIVHFTSSAVHQLWDEKVQQRIFRTMYMFVLHRVRDSSTFCIILVLVCCIILYIMFNHLISEPHCTACYYAARGTRTAHARDDRLFYVHTC